MSTETTCTCPSGDGSLRWSCPAHQPSLRTSASAATAVQPVLASDLVFGYPRELFRVTPAGDVVVSEGVSTTDAARAFWEAVAQTRPRPHAAVLSQPSGNFGQLQQPSAAALAAAQPAQGGTVTGWRMIDGMTVFDVASHSGIVEPQQFVRYDDYLAARQPVASADRMAIKMLVAAGFVSEDKANESLRIAHGFDGDLGQPAPAAVPMDARYSLDADPAGIRSRVADCITGTMMVGAQNHTPTPAGHWLEPFWKMAQADAALSHPAAVPVDGWQPMHTAPKDGTAVLALMDASDVPQSVRYNNGWRIAWDNHLIGGWDGPLRWMPLPATHPQPAAAKDGPR